MFGGVIRNFLGGDDTAVEVNDVIEQCARWYFPGYVRTTYPITWKCALQQIRQVIKGAYWNTTKDEFVIDISLFWHLHKRVPVAGVGNQYEFKSGFASRFLEYLAGHIKDTVDARLWNRLSELVGQGVNGIVFESVGHDKLTSTNKSYSIQVLKKFGRKKFQMNFYQKRRVLIRTPDAIKNLEDGAYGVLIFGNVPLVDAIIQPDTMLQFTVGESHGKATDIEKYAAIRDGLREKYKSKHKMVFVIPATNHGELKVVGVPDDLDCYWMTYEDDGQKKRKRYIR